MAIILVILFGVFLLLGVPISFTILTVASVGILTMSTISPVIIIQQLFMGIDTFTLMAVPLFIISGSIAAKGGTAKGLVDIMRLIFGKLPGGLAVSTVFACAVFAAISGSSLATIMAIGSMMIPILKNEGYPYEMGVGVAASAGSLGILIPPSVPMVVYCVAMGVSVGKQFMAGFIPGILLAVCWSIYIILHCKKKGYPVISDAASKVKPVTGSDILHGVPAMLFPVIILGSIYGGFATPTEAAAISIFYVILIEKFFYRTLPLAELPKLVSGSVVNAATILFILAAAQVLNYFVTTQQVPAMLADFISVYFQQKWLFLLVFFILCVIAGCFMDVLALIVVLGPIMKPALEAFGISLIHFGIITVLATQIGQITPPFGLNLFVTMRITGKTLGEVVKPTLPYLFILIAFALLITYVPGISLFLPNLMP
jgi:C4-dicarboxylate transporter DctM subunit